MVFLFIFLLFSGHLPGHVRWGKGIKIAMDGMGLLDTLYHHNTMYGLDAAGNILMTTTYTKGVYKKDWI